MAYPVTLELDAGPRVANWRPLVHWLLAIPHLVIAYALGYVSQAVALVSWLIIVFTGSLPATLAELQCMILRYTARVYSYVLWLREPYPPFDFTLSGADPGGDPLRLDITPELSGRNRLTVALRFIWVIPAAIFGTVLALAAGVALVVGFFAVLFTGRWPAGLRDFVVGVARYSVRLSAYFNLLTDAYPPFSLA
jgi:hypothetical protein